MQQSTNPFAYRKPITLDNLHELFGHHSALTGGWSMEGEGEGGGEGEGQGGEGGGDTYTPPATQADLDRILGQRLAREREKYSDYDDLKAKAAAHDKALDEAKSDAEKAVDAARTDGATKATEAANGRIVAAEARAIAAEAGFNIGAASVVRLLDLTGIKVGDDGQVDTEAIKTKLSDLKTAEPGLVGSTKKDPPKKDRSQGGGGSTDGPSVARGRSLFEERRRGGRKTTDA